MSDILHSLIEAFRGRLSQSAPAVLCGSPFGNAAVMVLHRLGANFQPYAIVLDDGPVEEILTIADRLDRRLKLISIAPHNVGADFVHLAVHHRCSMKTEFALGSLVIHTCEAIEETEIWLSLPRSSFDHRGWRTAMLIADHYGKTLVNPHHGLGPLVDVDSVMRIASEATAIS